MFDKNSQKFSTFGNLLLEKPGNQFAIAKLCEKQLKEKESSGEMTCIFT